MLSTHAGLNSRKRKTSGLKSPSYGILSQDARQKAMIVFPRVPVVISSSSTRSDSRSSGSGFISQAAICSSVAPGSKAHTLPVHLRSGPVVQKRDTSWAVIRRVRNCRLRDRGQDRARHSRNRKNVPPPSLHREVNWLRRRQESLVKGEQLHPEPGRVRVLLAPANSFLDRPTLAAIAGRRVD